MRTSIKRIALLLSIVTSCVGCDQVTKAAARECLAYSPPMSFLGDVFRLEYVENPGAFLGVGANLSDHWRATLLIAGACAWLLAVAFMLTRELSLPRFSGLALILAGGIGNLIDRILNHNAVVDFMNIGIGSVRTGIFNVADVALMCGAALLVLSSMERRPDPSP